MKPITIFFLVFLLIQVNLEAQNTNEATDFSYALGNVSYMSDAVFMGRRDSIKAPYVFSSLGYYDKSGFFGNASASYLVSSEDQRFDLFLISAGYLFSKKNLSGGISGTKYFFDEESYNVQSEIEADITAMVAYDFKVTEITLSAISYFGSDSSSDLVASLKLDRTFYAMNKKLLIMPALELQAGTQYFYEEYYNTSRLGNRKGGNGKQGPASSPKGPGKMQDEIITTDVTISEASEFNILNLEASLPLQFYHKQFIFSFTPVMAFPQTPASITTDTGIYEEDLENIFYWSAGISYWFKL
ncbi:MAG: hypothetical protein WBL21_01485 [Salinimicrobium sp.]